MINFDLISSTKIFFGAGKINNLCNEIQKHGRRILFVYGEGSVKRAGLYDKICSILNKEGLHYNELGGVTPNPLISTVRKGVSLCRENRLDFVLACGGGSVIDCAKAIAAGFFMEEDTWEMYSKRLVVKKALPIGTILTLAASGSEMNGYTVISNSETQEKLSTGSEVLRPKFSILDPTITFTVPHEQTATGVVDIFAHIMEQYFSPERDAFVSDRLAESLFKVCIKYGKIVLDETNNYEARANIMWAGSLALNGLLRAGKTGDWATHMIEHEISALYDVSHGLGLAVLIPGWMRYVLDDTTKDKFNDYARFVWGIEGKDEMSMAEESIRRTEEFFLSLGMPKSLFKIGVKSDKLKLIAEKAVSRGSIGSFKILEKSDVLSILKGVC